MTDVRRLEPTLLQAYALRALGELLFWAVILQLVAGLYLQSQLAVFGGRILVPNGAPKLLLVVAILGLSGVALWMQRGRIALRHCTLPACIFTCYLAVDLAWLIFASGLTPEAVLLGFNKYFLFFLAIPGAALLAPQLSSRQMNFRLMLLLLPLIAVALAQYIADDPLLPTSSEDESWKIPAAHFFGRTRAFSLFRGVLECGQGMAFFGALLVAHACASRRRHVAWYVLLFALSAAACYATLRRGAYLEFGGAAAAAVAISFRWNFSRWLPWAYLAFGIALASGGALFGPSQEEGVMSSGTLAERQEAWNSALDKWLYRNDESLFLGTGMAQFDSDEQQEVLVDNGFLAVAVQTGLIGLTLWIWVMQALWRDMLATAWRTGSTLAIAVAALLSTWMMRDMFDPLFATYPLYVYLVFWSRDEVAPSSSTSMKPKRQVATCA